MPGGSRHSSWSVHPLGDGREYSRWSPSTCKHYLQFAACFLQRNGINSCEVTRHKSSDLPQGGLEIPRKLIFAGAARDTFIVQNLLQIAKSSGLELTCTKTPVKRGSCKWMQIVFHSLIRRNCMMAKAEWPPHQLFLSASEEAVPKVEGSSVYYCRKKSQNAKYSMVCRSSTAVVTTG